MDRLEDPAHLPGQDIERDDGRGIFLDIGAAVAAELVGRRVAHRYIDEAKIRIGAQDRPAVRRIMRIGLARRDRLGFVRIAAVPVPDELAGCFVIGTDDAGRLLCRDIVVHRAADDDQPARDHHRRGRIIKARSQIRHVRLEVDDALVSEALADLARLRVERDEACIRRRQQDARLAGGGADGRRRRVVGDATAGLVLAVDVLADPGVEAPALLPGIGVEGDGDIVRGAQIERLADLERRHFVGRLDRIAFSPDVAGVIGPGDFQPRDVGRGDLGQWRIAQAGIGTAVDRPLTVRDDRIQLGLVGRSRRQRAGKIVGRRRHRISGDRDTGDDRRRQRQAVPTEGGSVARALGIAQLARHPRHQEPDADQDDDVTARRQAPPVETGLVDGP